MELRGWRAELREKVLIQYCRFCCFIISGDARTRIMEEIIGKSLNIFLCTESGKNLCGSDIALTDQNHVAALWIESLKKCNFSNLFRSD